MFRRPGFPPIVYFAADESSRMAADRQKVAAFFVRDQIRHKALIVRLGDIIRAQRRTSSTNSLFVGDVGIHLSCSNVGMAEKCLH